MREPFFRRGDRPWFHLFLLVLTLGTTTLTFRWTFGGGESITDGWGEALVFSSTLLAILGAHEMGHYLFARHHGVDSTLPYFIPLPLLGVGTLGAVIRLRSPIPTRNALVDIGAAGPLAGLVVALPVLWFGLQYSSVVDAPPTEGTLPAPGSLLALAVDLIDYLRYLLGEIPAAAEPNHTRFYYLFGDNLLLRGLQYLVLGPLPEGKDLAVHPLVIAGWFGMLVTMLNLIPLGQLDGGHLSFALLGRRARYVGMAMAGVMTFFCFFFSAGWVVWLLVTTKLIGLGHPDVVEPHVPLDRSRRVICALCAVALVLCTMPIPLSLVGAP